MPTTKTNPNLTPEVVADEGATVAQIDRLLRRNPQHRKHVRAILKAQEALHRVLSDREWQVYLTLEAAVNARFSDALLAVARWAFEQGRRHPLRAGK